MSVYTCAQLRDVAPELALNVLGGAERGDALVHLNHCTRCQAHVAELTEAADAIPLLAAEREPSPDFERRVLAALGARRRRNLRRLAASVAVTAAAAAIVSIAIVRVIDARNEPVVAAPEAPALVQVQMFAESNGAPAGWASVSGERAVAVAVDYGIEPGRYAIEVQPSTGPAQVIGDVTVADGQGSWSGTSPVAINDGTRISLVSATGARVCHGSVEAER